MKRILYAAVLASFFVGASVLTSVVAFGQQTHHPAGTQETGTSSSPGMMQQQGAGMNQMPCMAAPSSGGKSQMMGMMGKGMGDRMGSGRSGMMSGGGMQGMMQEMMPMFYLDRAAELDLSTDQISKLKTIQVDGRKDNIRKAAEVKIARLELSELLAGENWTLKDAESLVRKVQTLEGDIHIRHLQAVSDARKVLTAEQLKQAQTDDSIGNMESLFQ